MSILTTQRLRIPLRVLWGMCVRIPRGGRTLVLSSRNDDYGNRPIERLLACIEWNQRWLACDTLFVEWNPPEDRELLSHMLTERFERLTCYVVSRRLHATVAGDSRMPFLEYHAKNVGLRRATTDWVAIGNTDVIVLPDCRPGLGRAKPDEILRTRRVDFPFEGRRPMPLEVLDGRRYLRLRSIEGLGASAPGDFTMAHRDLWRAAGGYDETNPRRRVYCDVRGMHQLQAHGGHVRWIGTHLHFDHPESTSSGWAAHHGEPFEPDADIPYENPANWGLGDATTRQIADRIWELDT